MTMKTIMTTTAIIILRRMMRTTCMRMTLTGSQILLLLAPPEMSLSTLKSLKSSETMRLVKSQKSSKKRRKRKSHKRPTTTWSKVTQALARIVTKSMSTLIRSASSASSKLIEASMVRLMWESTRIPLSISQMTEEITKAKRRNLWVTLAMKQTRQMKTTIALTSMIKSKNITKQSLSYIVIMTMMSGKSLSSMRDNIRSHLRMNPSI